LAKLEGNNPAGSVKDRAAVSMIMGAESRGSIKKKDVLIEATSGNTGIALAMAARLLDYKMRLIMPENLSIERRQVMKAFGADLILVSKEIGMEGARDLANEMEKKGEGRVLNQFSNDDNWLAHYKNTGKEILDATNNRVTHFISAMGTTGTITGVSRRLKEFNNGIQIIGVQPSDGSQIPGIRKWVDPYIPPIRKKAFIDNIMEVSQSESEEMARRMALEEGIFCGPSGAGALCTALRVAEKLESAVLAFIVCDRGDRYLSTNIFPS
jgi:cysteine synthase B